MNDDGRGEEGQEKTSTDNNNQRRRGVSWDELADGPTGRSPAESQASQSSSTRRIVELLPGMDLNNGNNRGGAAQNWCIGPEFFNMDLAGEHENEVEEDDDNVIENGADDYEWSDDGRDGIDDDEEVDEIEDDEQMGDGFPDFELVDIVPYVYEEHVESSSEDEPDENGQVSNYDTTLPANHRYLGENLEESRGRQILVEGIETDLTLFNLDKFDQVVLLPGQTLPITTAFLNHRIHMQMRSCLTRGMTLIGIISDPRRNKIGTTADIRSYLNEGEDVKIIMEGRQRFELVSQPFDVVVIGKVKILPEISLGRPYPSIASWRRFLTQPQTAKKLIVSKHPSWFLKAHEANNIMKRVLDQIRDWMGGDITRNPNEFSYWVAANLPISNSDRLKMLTIDCIESRLLWLMELLVDRDHFGCSVCKNVICHKTDVFPMSCSGPQNSFVNPDGYVHDTLTVRKTRGLLQDGQWSNQYSWFPGYAWRTVSCSECSTHIGWCFKSSKAGVKPKKFYGLSRRNVRLLLKPQRPVSTNGSQMDAGSGEQ